MKLFFKFIFSALLLASSFAHAASWTVTDFGQNLPRRARALLNAIGPHDTVVVSRSGEAAAIHRKGRRSIMVIGRSAVLYTVRVKRGAKLELVEDDGTILVLRKSRHIALNPALALDKTFRITDGTAEALLSDGCLLFSRWAKMSHAGVRIGLYAACGGGDPVELSAGLTTGADEVARVIPRGADVIFAVDSNWWREEPYIKTYLYSPGAGVTALEHLSSVSSEPGYPYGLRSPLDVLESGEVVTLRGESSGALILERVDPLSGAAQLIGGLPSCDESKLGCNPGASNVGVLSVFPEALAVPLAAKGNLVAFSDDGSVVLLAQRRRVRRLRRYLWVP